MVRGSTITKAYPLNIRLSGGTSTATSDSYVKLYNRTTTYYKILKAVNNEVLFDISNLSSDGTDTGTTGAITVGDIIDIWVSGIRTGTTTHTISAGRGSRRVSVTCTDVSTTNAPAVSI